MKLKIPKVNGSSLAVGVAGAGLLGLGLYLYSHRSASDPPSIYYDSGGSLGGGGGGFGGNRPLIPPEPEPPPPLGFHGRPIKPMPPLGFHGDPGFGNRDGGANDQAVRYARTLAGLRLLGSEHTPGGMRNAG